MCLPSLLGVISDPFVGKIYQASLRDARPFWRLTRGLKPHGYHRETAPRSFKTSKFQRGAGKRHGRWLVFRYAPIAFHWGLGLAGFGLLALVSWLTVILMNEIQSSKSRSQVG